MVENAKKNETNELPFLYNIDKTQQKSLLDMFNPTKNHFFSALLIEMYGPGQTKLDEELAQSVIINTDQFLSACVIDYKIATIHDVVVIYFNYDNYNIRTLTDSLKMILFNLLDQKAFLNFYYTTKQPSLAAVESELGYIWNNRQYSKINGYWQRLSILEIKECNASTRQPSENALSFVYNSLCEQRFELVIDYINEKRENIHNMHNPEHYYHYSNVLNMFMEIYMAVKLYYSQRNYFDLFFSRDLSEIETRYNGGIYRLLELINLSLQNYVLINNPVIESGNDLIDSVLQYTQDNLKTITLASCAAHFHISTAHLSRSFKAVMGQNFSEYVSEKKLAQAANMLVSNPELTVAQIAEHMNYSTSAYFLNKFKQKYGITPNAFRRRAHSESL